MKKFSALVAVFSVVVSLVGCAGSNKQGLPNHIDFNKTEAAEVAMHAEEFRVMDSLANVGRLLAWQDGVAWVASDSLMADLPKSQLKNLKGWVSQGNLRDGFCLFYGKDSSGYYQLARYDFTPQGMNRAIARTEIPEGDLMELVQMNDSAYQFFKKSGEAFNVKYNTYILKGENGYTFYAIPGSTSEYVILGGAAKLTIEGDSWKVENLHKSPIAMEWKSITKDTRPVRTSSMSDILNEADFAQYYIYEKSMPDQYIKTRKYLIGLLHDNNGKMAIVVVK